jgi:hypothetical protein
MAKRGLLRTAGRSLALPYLKLWDSGARLVSAAKYIDHAMNTAKERETDALADDSTRPAHPSRRFEWYCAQCGLTEDELWARHASFEFLRKLCIVCAAVSLIAAVPMSLFRLRVFGVADAAVAMAFAALSFKHAYFAYQIRHRRIYTRSEFLALPTLFREWFAWSRQ